ncbi:MAG: 2-oxo acid dehydrogenase subunit E2 [Acidobacteriia bacterium]|nr:2-oxo acid dehydrogenase subunit E2 [Terriglobia bacterium]
MAAVIKLPDMGTNVEECKLLAWRVGEGEHVNRGQVLADIETDKAVAELESTAEGVVLRQMVSAGGTARTGDILAYVGQPGETIPEGAVAYDAAGTAPVAEQVAKETPSPTARGAAPRVSMIVRNLAAKENVDLTKLEGTGPGGIITREDVLRASRAASAPMSATVGEGLSRAQAAVARAVLKSWREIPHLHVTAGIDMTAAERVRAEQAASDRRPSYDAIFLKALARAIEAVPRVAAKLEGERLVKMEGIHIALAVDVAGELFLPVIRDINSKNLLAVQAEIAEVTAKVRTGVLRAEQMTGASMALSNLGMYPIEDFDAIIFPEHSMILAVGSVQKKAVVVDNRVGIRPIVGVRLAADHRLINGRSAAEFLSKVKQCLESGDFL